jgi:hypothetical protein
VWVHAAAWLLAGCAELLGIPDDPLLVPGQAPFVEPVGASAGSGGGAQLAPPSNEPLVPDAGRGAEGLGGDGVLPPGSVVGIDGALAPDASTNAPGGGELDPRAEPSLDAGAELDGAVAADAQDCNGFLGRVPVDVIVVFDNSGSMVAEAAAFEEALPAFAERLDADGVDHRIILISRHRVAGRESSDEAATSICIGAPLGGGGGCPSESPAPGPRFFHYSIKIDASDSFARIVESFTEPDPFGLTDSGWSAWLRAGARKVFIEITDGNSNASVDAFSSALAARDQSGLFSAEGRPDFVFHGITGVVSKRVALGVYDASEPIESLTCSGDGGNPGNAGEIYQVLSRRTGGLRMPVCPPSLLGSRLQILATDVALRSLRVCPQGD